MAKKFDARFQMVTCRGCGKHYRCTPSADYYNSTTDSDGVCWDCLLAEKKPGKTALEPTPGTPFTRFGDKRGEDGG